MHSQTNTNPIPAEKLLSMLAEAQAGKEAALAEIYETYFLKIYRFIYYRVNHKETAEDLTEDVFIKAFKKLNGLKEVDAFEGWLYQIARNLVIDYYRKKKQTVQIETLENTLEYDSNISEVINLQIEQSILVKLLAELNDEQQSVIKMKFIEDLDNNTIAGVLNKTEGAIRVIQHRAISKLKELFQRNSNNRNE